jgi:hypothetical protein
VARRGRTGLRRHARRRGATPPGKARTDGLRSHASWRAATTGERVIPGRGAAAPRVAKEGLGLTGEPAEATLLTSAER